MTAPIPAGIASGVLWDEWVDAWLACASVSSLTTMNRRSRLRGLARAVAGKRPDEVTTADLAAWLDRGWAPGTRRAYYDVASGFFAWLARSGRITSDPTLDLRAPRRPRPRPRPVPDDTYDEAMSAAPDLSMRVALRLAGEAGLRRAEVAAIHRRHLVREPDGWVLRFVGKGDVERTVPIVDDLAEQLLTLTAAGWAFPSARRPGRPLSAGWVGTLISRLLPEGYTMHKLRHRAGTLVYQRSHDLYLVAELLGHASVSTTQAYVPPDRARLRAAVSGGAA